MKFIEGGEKNFEKGLVNNPDPYGNRCFTYAQQWAELLEKRIPDDATDAQVTRIFVDHAKQDSRTADTDGITGFMYGAAVSILAGCWKYGEALRRWHNLETQLRDEGTKANAEGGVLNPALLNIG